MEKCQELANIEYQNMLVSGNFKTNNSDNKNDIETIFNIEEFLEKEKNLESKLPWNKLNKMKKYEKICIYINKLSEDKDISDKNKKDILSIIKIALNKKKLQRVKEVVYNKETGIIKNIPSIEYDSKEKKLSFNINEKKQSTLKSLAPKKGSLNKKSKIQKSQKTQKKTSPKHNISVKVKSSPKEKGKNKQKTKHQISPKKK